MVVTWSGRRLYPLHCMKRLLLKRSIIASTNIALLWRTRQRSSYRESQWRWRHPPEIRERYGYRDFSDEFAQWRLLRWLYALCWIGTDRPSALFDQATAWLVTHKVLLPRCHRARTGNRPRAWSREQPPLALAGGTNHGGSQGTSRRLGGRPWERSAESDGSASIGTGAAKRARTCAGVKRLDEVRELTKGLPHTDKLPKTRILALARFANAAKAQAVRPVCRRSDELPPCWRSSGRLKRAPKMTCSICST